jgi:hypothetical protein
LLTGLQRSPLRRLRSLLRSEQAMQEHNGLRPKLIR